jgi:hypothetical protein
VFSLPVEKQILDGGDRCEKLKTCENWLNFGKKSIFHEILAKF